MQNLNKARLFSLLMLMIVLVSCEKEKYEQPVYFEYSYMNYAWGKQHYGWLMDLNGHIKYYYEPDKWHFGDEDGITYKDLMENLSQTDSIITSVEIDILKEKIKLIREADKGEISEQVHTGCDFGGAALCAYYFCPETRKYKSVFLAQTGDWECHNTNPAAQELVNWLKQYTLFWLDL